MELKVNSNSHTLKNNVHHIDYFIVFVGQDGRPFPGKGRGMGLTQIYHAEARSCKSRFDCEVSCETQRSEKKGS